MVPLVSWMVKTSAQGTERKPKSRVTGGWCERMVGPETIGSSSRSSWVRMSLALTPFASSQWR